MGGSVEWRHRQTVHGAIRPAVGGRIDLSCLLADKLYKPSFGGCASCPRPRTNKQIMRPDASLQNSTTPFAHACPSKCQPKHDHPPQNNRYKSPSNPNNQPPLPRITDRKTQQPNPGHPTETNNHSVPRTTDITQKKRKKETGILPQQNPHPLLHARLRRLQPSLHNNTLPAPDLHDP